MKGVSFLTVRWLVIFCLVFISVFATSQAVDAGTPGTEPVFSISGLWISPTEVNTGQTVTISAIVREAQNVSGIYEATLTINGIGEETKKVTVGPMASEQITFIVSKKEVGTYSVDLNGLKGSFTVVSSTATGSPTNGQSGSSFPTIPVVIGIVAALMIVGLLIFYLNKKRLHS